MHLRKLEKRKMFVSLCSLAQVDLCVVSETKLDPGQGQVSMNEVIDSKEFEWMSKERKDQKSKGGEGGVGILVRKRLGKLDRVKTSERFEILWVQVEVGSELLFIAAVYLPPLNSRKKVVREEFIRELEQDIFEFSRKGKVLILGDLNHRIGNMPSVVYHRGHKVVLERRSKDTAKDQVKKAGGKLLEVFNANKLIVLNGLEDEGENTFFGSKKKSESMIDFIVINYEMFCNEEEDEDIEEYTHKLERKDRKVQRDQARERCAYVRNSFKVWNDFIHIISDHRLITCQIVIPKKPTPSISGSISGNQEGGRLENIRLVPKWNRGSRDGQVWEEFRTKVVEKLRNWHHRLAKGSGQLLSEMLVCGMNEAARESLGQKRHRKKRKRKLEWDVELDELTQEEKIAYDNWKLADGKKREEEFLVYRAIQRIKRRKRRCAYKRAQEKLQEKIGKLRSKDPKEYWNMLRRLNAEETKRELPSKMRNEAGVLVGGREKLEVWRNYFQRLGKEEKESKDFDESFKTQIEVEIDEIGEEGGNEHDDLRVSMNREFEDEEIAEAIRKLRVGKAVGIDGVMNEMIKYGEEDLQRCIKELLNQVWREERIPDDWKKGLIFPIFKGGPPEYASDPSRYRGITLLSVLGKLYTSILNERLTVFTERAKSLDEEQAGFRKGRATVDQVFIMHEIIKNHRPLPTYCCFVDIQKAYDRVWREGLWKRLYECGISGKMWRVIKNIYERVESCVLIDEIMTEFFVVDIGVRQGCNLSPLLFALFINGLAEEIKKLGKGILHGKVRICILLFADDIVLLAESRKDLELLMNITYQYSRRWRFDFNYDKSAVVVYKYENKAQQIVYGECTTECRCGFHWKLGSTLIVQVDMYKYLGMELDQKLSFKKFKERILSNARRCRAKAWGMGMGSNRLSVQASVNIWEGVVRQNLEYGAQVWGEGKWVEAEKLACGVAKSILNCSKKTPDVAARGELGWWKLETRRDYLKLKFWIKILFMEETRLVKQVYKASKQMYLSNGKKNWAAGIHKLTRKYNFVEVWDDESMVFEVQQDDPSAEGKMIVWYKMLYNSIQNTEEKEWQQEVASKRKLRNYKSLKTDLKLEQYLTMESNKKGRHLLTQLRVGNSNLRIERGRWVGEKEQDRKCMTCMSGEVEDERHFVLDCVTYSDLREKMFRDIFLLSKGKWNMSEVEREVRWKVLLAGSKDIFSKEILEIVKFFVKKAFDRRSFV